MKILILLICSISIFSFASAQSKTESIDLLFRLMKKDSLLEINMKNVMGNKQITSMLGKNDALTSNDSILLVQKMEGLKTLYNKILVDEKALYDKHFNHNEILEMISFYQSPTGMKMINESNLIQSELQNIIMEKYTPEILRQITDTQYSKNKQ